MIIKNIITKKQIDRKNHQKKPKKTRKKQENTNKNKTCIFRSFCCFLFFPWFWFSSSFVLFALVLFFLVKPYILCVVGLIKLHMFWSNAHFCWLNSDIYQLDYILCLLRPTFCHSHRHLFPLERLIFVRCVSRRSVGRSRPKPSAKPRRAKRLAQEAEAQRRAEAKAEDFGMVSTEDERTSLLGLLDRLYML